MAELSLHPSGTRTGSNGTWADASNAYDAETTSDAATCTYEQLASTTMYGVLTFDLSSLPSGATISAIEWSTVCSIDSAYGKGSNGSWNDAGAALQVNGEDVDSGSLSSKSSQTNLSGTVTPSGSVSSIAIKYFYETNSYGDQDRSGVMSVYGATITITYTGGKTYKVTASATGGTITPSGEQEISEGTSVTFELTPDNDKEFGSLTVNGVAVSPSTKTIYDTPGAYILLHLDDDTTDALGHSNPSGTGSISSDVVHFGSGSYYLNGSSYLTIPFVPSTNTYTLDFWVYITAENQSGHYPTVFSTEAYSNSGGAYMHVDDGSYSTNPVCRVNAANSSSNNGGYGTTVLTRNAWHHIEWCRNDAANYFFIDGKLQRTVSQANPHAIENIYIGALRGGSGIVNNTYLTGYVDEIMIADVCAHTEDFEPKTEAFSTGSHDILEYTLSNVQQDTVIAVTFKGSTTLYIKTATGWAPFTKAYKKVNGVWQDISLSSAFTSTTNYVRKEGS